MSSRRPVVLYHPRGRGLGLPLELLQASSAIVDREAVIVDGRHDVAPEGRIGELAHEALLLVVGAPGGAALLDAHRITARARAVSASLPVLWLGAYAAAQPADCLASGADACAIGPAEQTLPELVAAIEAGASLDGVSGLAVPAAGAARATLERTAAGPPPAPLRYDRLDLERHFRWHGERRLEYVSSRILPGPGAAGQRRFEGLPAEAVVAELAQLAQRYRLAAVDFVDEEFFADLRRAEAIARGLQAAGPRLAWTARGRAELLRRLTEDAAAALRPSGCARITVDAVSGSAGARARVADAPDEAALFEAARKLARHAVPASFEFVAGVPGEPPTAVHDTYRMARALHRLAPGTTTPIRIWRPDPESAPPTDLAPGPAWPADLAAWAAVDARALDWVRGPVRRWAPRFDFYLRWANERPRRGLGRLLIHWLARLRVTTGVYGLDFERALVELGRRLRTASKAARPGSVGWEP